MSDFGRYLNTCLTTAKRKKPQPAVHVVNGIEIVKRRGLWTATIDGKTYNNSRLGDLKAQLEGIKAC